MAEKPAQRPAASTTPAKAARWLEKAYQDQRLARLARIGRGALRIVAFTATLVLF
jgi:hypothetical protein